MDRYSSRLIITAVESLSPHKKVTTQSSHCNDSCFVHFSQSINNLFSVALKFIFIECQAPVTMKSIFAYLTSSSLNHVRLKSEN